MSGAEKVQSKQRRAILARRGPAIQRTARDVLARIAELEIRAAEMWPAVEQLQTTAPAVAQEYGHDLGPWYYGDGLVTAARCTGCTASVALKADGHGSNNDPCRYLREPCAHLRPRFYAVKSGRGYFVRDRERPMYAGEMIASKARATARAKALNTGAGAGVVSPVEAARARVERARLALARAEQALHKLTGESPADHTPGLRLVTAATIEEVPMPATKTKSGTTKTPRKRSTPKAKAPAGAQPLASGPEMAAEILAGEGRPMHVAVIIERVLARDAKRPPASRAYKGKTPGATLSSQLTMSHVNGRTFIRTAPATFGLREWTDEQLGREPVGKPAKAATVEAA